MPRTGKSIARIISLLIVSVCVCLVFVSLALARRDALIYPSNVWAGEVAIGDLSREQAAKALTLNSRVADALSMNLPDRTLRIPIKNLGIKYNNEATLIKVDIRLSNKEGMAGILHHLIIRGKRQEIAPVFDFDTGKLKQNMLVIKAENDKPATDARILYYNNYWEYVSHSNGYIIDPGKSFRIIEMALKRGSLVNIALSVTEISPRVKLGDISQIDGIIGRSVIDLSGSRSQNASTLKYVNGLIMLPGDRFDMAMPGKEYSGLIIGALSSACFEAGLQSQGRYIYNNLDHPILISSVNNDNSLVIRIYSCRGGSNS